MTRRANDWYPTETWATQELLQRVPLRGLILEPCVGDGAISKELVARGHTVLTNDLDSQWPADTHCDARELRFWNEIHVDWVVTNPPFSVAHEILPGAQRCVKKGVAMLLRITYLEPCEGRAGWLARYPPDKLIVLPRMSFTGDGQTDSATCAWMIWTRDHIIPGLPIVIVPPADLLPGALFEANT